MTNSILRSVRFAFVTLLLGLTVFTVVESALAGDHASAQAQAEGLSACGSEEQPCALEAVSVVVGPAPSAALAANEGLADCGSQAEPCVLAPIAIEAKREAARLASADRAPPMMVRAGS
jgi:precorrin isomerase